MPMADILLVHAGKRCLLQGKRNLNKPWLVVHIVPIAPPKFPGIGPGIVANVLIPVPLP